MATKTNQFSITIDQLQITWELSLYKSKVKSSSLDYNRRKTQDKQPLGWDQDRS